jgi:hypothetical protein
MRLFCSNDIPSKARISVQTILPIHPAQEEYDTQGIAESVVEILL